MPAITDEHGRGVWTSDEGTMAKQTAVTRWPKIIQSAIEDVAETAAQADGDKRAESVTIQTALKQLQNEIEQDKPLTQLPSDGSADIDGYNEQLAAIGECSWLNCPWLFGECYMYRRIQSILAASQHWQNYDVFKRQKDSTFVKSRAAVEELASRYMQVVADSALTTDSNSSSSSSEEARKLLFIEMTEIALWGNATDLSLLSHLTLDDLQSLQGRDAIAKSQRNVVDNDTAAVWTYLTRPRPSQSTRRIDLVLDNAGFEFFTDLLYAAYLLDSGIATTVTLHAKRFPWFVSDVVPADVDALFAHLASPDCFPARESLDRLVPRLRALFDSRAISVSTHPFWTTAYSFHELPTRAPALYQDLQNSYLTIWKGDLNYRKLTRDGLWPHTTPFRDAMGPMGRHSGVKVLALRTNKSDTCVGVETQERVDALHGEAPNGAWIRNGKYAVISFNEGD